MASGLGRLVVAVSVNGGDLSRAVEDLYEANWGRPSSRARFEVEGLSIEVLTWRPAENPEGVALYATVGASEKTLPGHDSTHRMEFFIGLLPGRDEVAGPLAALGLYSAREGVALDHGHTVPSDTPLWPGCRMSSLLVIRTRDDYLRALELPRGLHVEFLQAIPIYDSERSFKHRYGTDALLELWESAGVPFWNPERAPYPT